jgi:hypothetical protein
MFARLQNLFGRRTKETDPDQLYKKTKMSPHNQTRIPMTLHNQTSYVEKNERIPMTLHDRIIRDMWIVHFRTRIRNPDFWAYVHAMKSFDWKKNNSISKHLKLYGIEAKPLGPYEDWGRIFWYWEMMDKNIWILLMMVMINRNIFLCITKMRLIKNQFSNDRNSMSFYEGFFKALLKRKNSTLIQPITQCKQCLTDIGFIKFECYNETININDYNRPSYSTPIASIRQWDQITIRYVKRELIHFYKLCRACPILYLFHNIEKDIAGFLKERQNRIDEEFIKLHNRFITHRVPFNPLRGKGWVAFQSPGVFRNPWDVRRLIPNNSPEIYFISTWLNI